MGTKANDLLIDTTSTRRASCCCFAGEIRDLFPRIKALTKGYSCCNRFVHVLSDPDGARRSSPTAGSGPRDEVSDWETTPAHALQASEIAQVIKKFNDANPGHRPNHGPEHRDLRDQIRGRTHNAGVRPMRRGIPGTKARIEIKRKVKDGTPRYPDPVT